jgi:hypothetical protein
MELSTIFVIMYHSKSLFCQEVLSISSAFYNAPNNDMPFCVLNMTDNAQFVAFLHSIISLKAVLSMHLSSIHILVVLSVFFNSLIPAPYIS